jgi:hypothetical protein
MKKFLPLFISACLPFALEAAANYFTPPKGWEIIDTKVVAPQVEFMARGKTVNMFASTMNLTLEPTDLAIDVYMQEVEKIYQEPSKTVTLLGTLQTKSGPMRILQIDEKLPWAELRILQGIMIKDNMAYVVTATTEDDQFPSLITPFLESMKSFTIKGPTEK